MSNSGKRRRSIDEILGIEPKLLSVIEFVADKRGFTFEQIRERRNFEELVQARGEVAYVINYFFNQKINLTDISVLLNKSNHSTIHHLIKKVDDNMSINQKYKSHIMNILADVDMTFDINSNKILKDMMLRNISTAITRNKNLEAEYKNLFQIQDEFHRILTIRDSINSQLESLYSKILKDYGEQKKG